MLLEDFELGLMLLLVEESEADRLRLIGQKKDKELSYVAEIVPPFSTGQELPNPVLAIEKEISLALGVLSFLSYCSESYPGYGTLGPESIIVF